MHRFPNPGSDIKNSIESLKFITDNIEDDEYFDLFDMKELLVLNGFISSSGATGLRALQKGDNVDRSKDTTYNQCKMYAEVYRALGWVSSVDKALDYYISSFGRHILNSKVKPQLIFEHCLLGIENPNGVLEIPREYRLRPFLAILKCAKVLGGNLSKDEMIYAPLFLNDDTNDNEMASVCHEILDLRKDRSLFSKMLNAKCEERGIKLNTAWNYTRFPIAAIQWVNWFVKRQGRFYLTDYGYAALDLAEQKYDLRHDDIDDNNLLVNVARYSYYQFLLDHGYALGDLEPVYEAAKSNLPSHIVDHGTLFSPFSTLDSKKLSEIFNFSIPSKKRKNNLELEENTVGTASDIKNTAPFKLIESAANPDNEYSKTLKELLELHSDEKVIRLVKSKVKKYKKEEFYPWISDVFSILGITCNIPQHGNNSVRWDAILLNEDNSDTVPIELKSPTEELHLSTKAIRQALENKIVLQSRRALPNKHESSTLAIGFELPNQRSEVEALITAFYNIFGFSIAVIGTEHLIKLSIQCIKEGKKLKFADFTGIRGIIYD